MAVAKNREFRNVGGHIRETILVSTDAAIAVTQAGITLPNTIVADVQIPKHAKIEITALDANRAETAVLAPVMGRATSDGANPSVITGYLWCTNGAGVSVPINGFLKLEATWNEGVVSD